MNVMMGSSLLLNSAGYQISRSVRLRSSASAYFNRTPASAGNRKTWTWSAWVKRGLLSSTDQYNLFTCWSANNDTAFLQLGIYQDKLLVGGWLTNFLISTPVYRDPSAWYHVVITLDTTQATASNRLRVYVNGVEVTAWATDGRSSITQNSDMGINQAAEHNIGRRVPAAYYFDGYLTEINFIDGQALTPSSFGETNPVTGVWQPKKYAGTYGTNGFYLNFSDPSAATAAAIGADRSGNGNNWTPNNISVTAGVTYDSMLDVPTPWPDGGNGRGNYAVMNAADTSNAGATFSNANLTLTSASTGWKVAHSTIAITSGKWYAEFLHQGGYFQGGVCLTTDTNYSNYLGSVAAGYGYDTSNGFKYNAGSGSALGATLTTGDVLGVAFDADTGSLEFYKNGVSQGVAYTGLTNSVGYYIAVSKGGGASSVSANFGQRPFAYTPPSGFRALNTLNLPTPTIANGANYFAATTYTGTGASRSVDNTLNNVSFQPDFVWVKGRSGATDHALYDAVRGVQKQWETNTTTAETTETTGLTAFNSNGFTVGALAQMNTNTATYVGWQWKEGATQGFDIVLYTGNSTASRSVNHNLGVTPSMIFVKNRTTAQNNPVAHTSLAVGNLLLFDTTSASTASGTRLRLGNSTAFTVGDAADYTITNQTGNDYVAYCFAAIAGFSAFGSYTGNGSTDGTFVFCGFRPRFVMFKRSDAASAWTIYDTARDLFNPEQNYIQAQSSAAEAAAVTFDILANGFKLRTTGDPNVSGGTYIFAAFAENPLKYALAR
jgi:hypothetical protein